MTIISNIDIEDALQPYGVPPISGLADRIRTYTGLLIRWNRKIALTTVEDPGEIVKFHFGESLFALSQLKNEKSRLADVGSGAGFPGVPLAMADPALEVILVESNAKKCAFLAEVIRQLELTNARIYQGRMESLTQEVAPFGFVTARALGQFDTLLGWAHTRLAARGKLLLWLGESDAVELYRRPGWDWSRPQPIPGSARRVILSGSPQL